MSWGERRAPSGLSGEGPIEPYSSYCHSEHLGDGSLRPKGHWHSRVQETAYMRIAHRHEHA